MPYRGLFVGLTTLDFIYLSDRSLQQNQKLVARDYLTAAGGPATNAAVTFNYLGNQSQLFTVLGQHSLTQLIKSDLAQQAVEIVDLYPEKNDMPPISSIIVTAATGERAVISINALKSQGNKLVAPGMLIGIDVVLIDGHQIDTSMAIALMAHSKQIPVVLDGGSWKPGLEKLLPYVDYAVCSANFYPPECSNTAEVFNLLRQHGVLHVAITRGEQPIQYLSLGERQTLPVSKIEAVDTLGAGDIFHGAFCHFILQQDFPNALLSASKIASHSCQSFGTRSWMREKT